MVAEAGYSDIAKTIDQQAIARVPLRLRKIFSAKLNSAPTKLTSQARESYADAKAAPGASATSWRADPRFSRRAH
jgi:hypothetical protein